MSETMTNENNQTNNVDTDEKNVKQTDDPTIEYVSKSQATIIEPLLNSQRDNSKKKSNEIQNGNNKLPKNQNKLMATTSDAVNRSKNQTKDLSNKMGNLARALDSIKLLKQPKSRESALEKKFEFWETQPVPKLTESEPIGDQNEPIQPPMDPNQISKNSLTLPTGFIWVSLNIDQDEEELKELYNLLHENYVEDDDNMFRFNYSPDFLRWVLKPPGWNPEWFVGVRVHKPERKGKLVGFISAIPSKIRVYDKILNTVEINFLCVHKKLRSKRMAPVLISEITRRVRLQGIFQALYTAGVFLPKPIASCRYYHRSLNPKKLIEVGFSQLTRNMTISRSVKLYRLPEKPLLEGIRKFEQKDSKQVHALLAEHMKRFDLVPLFNMDELIHWLIPRPDVVDSYVVERSIKNKKEIIGFFSFYILPSTVMNHEKYKEIRAAYSFYNVSTEHCSLQDLMQDALIIAKNSNLDVFNALNQRDNEQFLEKLKFGCGDGDLHYYLFNWKCPSMKPEKVGVVLQ